MACLIAVLLPYLVGLGLSQGVQEEADTAVRFGADLYVTGQQFGRPIPLPLATVAEVQKIPGVTAVVPRIVGRIELGTENVSAVLVGVPVKDFPADLDCIQGRLYQGSKRNELVIGTELAQQLNLQVGSFIPYFYSNRNGERVSEVVGIFRSDVSLWQARLILTSFETAAHIFDQPALATDLLVYCRPGYQEPVQRAILHNVVVPVPGGQVGTRVVAREELTASCPRGYCTRGDLHSPVRVGLRRGHPGDHGDLRVWSIGTAAQDRDPQGHRLANRRIVVAEPGRKFLAQPGGRLSGALLAFAWLKGLNGYWIAGVFLSEVKRHPDSRCLFA